MRSSTPRVVDPSPGAALAGRYARVRAQTVALAAPLSAEDACAQSMPEASPAKWHLAHTTWFFEHFVLGRDAAFEPLRPDWHRLFNSYYRSAGPFHPRAGRGLLTRPSLAGVLAWRGEVDARVTALLAKGIDAALEERITLGLHHEQQHQELLLTDIRHLFWCNPLQPAWSALPLPQETADAALDFIAMPGGVAWIGAGGAGFAYDNERPRHPVLLQPFAMANRLASNREYRAFIDDGGYRTPALWLSDGWDRVEREGWQHPLYWSAGLDAEFTLAGPRALQPAAPVCNLAFFEADAFARWAGARLPREEEWEAFAATHGSSSGANLLDAGLLQPASAAGSLQLFGDVWEWTASAYIGYPGFRALDGSLGEYNGKFMAGQMVLRGGSCATPADHIRASYRNFFPPAARWQFAGVRLAKDA